MWKVPCITDPLCFASDALAQNSFVSIIRELRCENGSTSSTSSISKSIALNASLTFLKKSSELAARTNAHVKAPAAPSNVALPSFGTQFTIPNHTSLMAALSFLERRNRSKSNEPQAPSAEDARCLLAYEYALPDKERERLWVLDNTFPTIG